MVKLNKKAELTTQQIVVLVILILSFVILLFLIFRLNLGDVTNKEICHNSVVLKDKSKGFIGDLDCKTSYVCISGGGDCEDLGTDYKTIKVDSNEDIFKAIADEMVDCWWMFGEGEINYVGIFGGKTHCAICSVIKFDDKVKNHITYWQLYNYLETTQKTKSLTYLQYLYGLSKKREVLPDLGIAASEEIGLDKKFSVITGLDKNWVTSNKYVPVFFIEHDKVKGEPTGCTKFDITRA